MILGATDQKLWMFEVFWLPELPELQHNFVFGAKLLNQRLESRKD
jgi:hypothetical protein